MKKINYIEDAIEKSVKSLVIELKENSDVLDFIWSVVHGFLGFTENMKEMSVEERKILKQTTLKVIFILLQSKNCKVGNITATEFIKWELSPEEAVKKVDSEWKRLGNNSCPTEQPWFIIED